MSEVLAVASTSSMSMGSIPVVSPGWTMGASGSRGDVDVAVA